MFIIKSRLVQLSVLIVFIVAHGSAEEKEIEFKLLAPPLKTREELHSLYSSIPLSNEIGKFENFYYFYGINETFFEGKIAEYDSMGWMNGRRQNIHHKLPYIIANPSLRIPHISEAWCKFNPEDFFKLGFRIHQTHRELGLPYQAKCATCGPIIEGLNMLYYLYPERDFFNQEIQKLQIASRISNDVQEFCDHSDCEQNPRVSMVQDFFRVNDLHFGKWSKWNGEHATSESDRQVLGSPNGELAIFSQSPDGFTTMCGMELNGEIVSSNIFVNGDVVGDSPFLFSYDDYESLIVNQTSVKSSDLNLELFMSWDDWGCCSACCCPPAICGHELQSSADCENVFSARTRVGYLSIRKLVKDQPVNPAKKHYARISQLLSIPPYSHRGIPIFSSLFNRDELPYVIEEIRNATIPEFLKANNATDYVFSSGMFIESETCKLHPQKTDCAEWARCHNISLVEVSEDVLETAIDSCHQVQFVDILVGVETMKVTVNEHDNLRLRIDPEVHNMNVTKANWRVNLRKPKKYDDKRPCLLQDVVLRRDEILILNFAAWNLKIDLILENGRKVRITFQNSRIRHSAQVVQYTILYWALAIVVFFLLLITAIVLMHREKTRRLVKVIEAKT